MPDFTRPTLSSGTAGSSPWITHRAICTWSDPGRAKNDQAPKKKGEAAPRLANEL
ncbi:hypothetical protein QA244_002805 [Escherichia coli]|nr:hypothetical protein [Escherichia coli]